jgi:sialidase-1
MKILQLFVTACLTDLVLSQWFVSPNVEHEAAVWDPSVPYLGVKIKQYSSPIVGPTGTGSLLALSVAQPASNGSGHFVAQIVSVDGGVTWTHRRFDIDGKSLQDEYDEIHLGEILADSETGELFMVYSVSTATENSEWKTFLVSSEDGGESWRTVTDFSNISDPRRASFHPEPGQGLQLRHGVNYKGRILFCGQANSPYDGVTCIYSDDHGVNWELGALLPGIPYGSQKAYHDFVPTQSQAVELPDGTILFSIQNEQQFHSPSRIFAWSYDGGKSINPKDVYIEEQLPDPVCAAGMLYVHEYEVLLHSNPFSTDEKVNMMLSWSYDNGTSWSDNDHLRVWSGPSGSSCLTTIPGYPQYVGLLYEKESSISYALISLNPASNVGGVYEL